MANVIQIKRRTLANGTGTPSGLVQGEAAYSEFDQKLFIGIESAGQHVIAGKGAFVTWPGTGLFAQTAAAVGATPPTIAARVVTGTANQLSVADGNGIAGNPTISIVANPVIPGTGSITVPAGTTAQRSGTPIGGMARYNQDLDVLEWYSDAAVGWVQPSVGGISFGIITGDTGTGTADVGGDTLNIAGGLGIVTTASDTPEVLSIAFAPTELSAVVTVDADHIVFSDVSNAGAPAKELKSDFLIAHAKLASPTFTGVPAAPTAAPGVNTTQLATTSFVATSFAPLASPTFTGVPAAPTAAGGTNTTQIATTEYVTTAVQVAQQGIDPKASVRAATTVNGTLASAYANASVVDGITLATGNRILLKNQTTGAENGIYTVNASGAPTRATDADISAEVTAGMYTFVEEGTVNADSGWILTNDGAITLGTTALVFAQFSGAGQITAGAALIKTGNTLDVAVDGITIEVNADALRAKAGSNGQALVTAGGVAAWGQVSLTAGVTGTLPIGNGGMNLTALGTATYHLRVNAGATALEYSNVIDGGTF